ncbi:MAG: AMP-binding protein [Clostridia bacterium]|nr:AMP-binding protein [Clostridia bacterium]
MIKTIKAYRKPRLVTDMKDMLNLAFTDFADKDLYIYKENGEEKHYTRRNMYNDVAALGTAFAEIGIGKDKIAVIGEANPYYMTAYYAAINGGGVIIPLDKEISEEQIVNFLNLSEASAIVYTGSFNGRLTKHADELTTLKYFIPIAPSETECGDNIISMAKMIERGNSALAQGKREFVDHVIDPDAMCGLIFTSGTTGTSKGVMLSHRNLATAVNACIHAMEYDDRDRLVSVLPMNHTYEVTCGHLSVYLIGASVFLNDSLKYVLRNIAAFKPTALVMVPLFLETMHKKVWDEIEKKNLTGKVRAAIKISNGLLKLGIDKRDTFFSQITNAFGGNLRTIVCGGAPISPHIIDDFYAFGINVIEGYGITECSPLLAVNLPGKPVRKSVGKAVLGCEVMIDKTEGEETGEICARGDNVMLGYYKNEEATAEVFTEDGWFRTGDIGYMDKKGNIYITGRKKNVIILSNGKNIFPEEIEEHLAKCSLIKECVVVGRANANGDVVITAVIYPGEELTAEKTVEELRDMIKAEINTINRSLPAYKQVREIDIRTTEFEKTTTRKIKRFLVK